MLNAGKYRARPIAAALGVTGTGKEQIAVTFELVDPAGDRITWYGFFTEGTLDRTLQSLRHCGWQGTDLSEFCEEQLPAGFDQEVELDVQHEEYKGKTQVKVAWVNGGGGIALKNALSKDQAKAFAAKMQRTIAALDKESGRTPSAPKQQTLPKTAPAPAPTPTPTTANGARTATGEEPSPFSGDDLPY